MNPLLAEAFVGMFLAALAGCFALAFAAPGDAARSVGRIRARRNVFRTGSFAIGAGIVFTVQADAVAKLAELPPTDVGTLSAQTAGWMLIVAGVALLDGVLWWPRAADVPSDPSAA